MLCLAAAFYVALFPVGGSPDAYDFFQSYLAAPVIFALYIGWKLWTRDTNIFIPALQMDVTTGMRYTIEETRAMNYQKRDMSAKGLPKRILGALF